jgi:hypothetical protein
LIAELRSLVEARATVIAPHFPDKQNPAYLLKKFRGPIKGPVNIRAWWNGREWEAIEGSHRIAAAALSDVPITIERVQLDDVFPDLIGDPSRPEVSVADALAWFKDWSPTRPRYDVEVRVRG